MELKLDGDFIVYHGVRVAKLITDGSVTATSAGGFRDLINDIDIGTQEIVKRRQIDLCCLECQRIFL